MRSIPLILLVVLVVLLMGANDSLAAQDFTLTGIVTDTAGQRVAGAEIFIYDSINTRRAADFISAKSDVQGRYTVHLPSGHYWAVARVRQGQRYGPLSPGARHSGEPVAVDNATGGVMELDFAVADIRDAAKGQQKTKDDYVRIHGRVLGREGKPVASAYVIVNKARAFISVPDYVSAWTDESGSYEICVPAGSYFLGAATTFPPDPVMRLEKALKADGSKLDIATDLEMQLN